MDPRTEAQIKELKELTWTTIAPGEEASELEGGVWAILERKASTTIGNYQTKSLEYLGARLSARPLERSRDWKIMYSPTELGKLREKGIALTIRPAKEHNASEAKNGFGGAFR